MLVKSSGLKKGPFCWMDMVIFCSVQRRPCLNSRTLKVFLSRNGTLQGPSTCLVRCFGSYRDRETRILSGSAIGANFFCLPHFLQRFFDCKKLTEYIWVSDQTWSVVPGGSSPDALWTVATWSTPFSSGVGASRGGYKWTTSPTSLEGRRVLGKTSTSLPSQCF